MKEEAKRYYILAGMSIVCSIIFMVAWIFLHPYVKDVFLPIAKSVLQSRMDHEINPVFGLLLTHLIDLSEYLVMSLIAAMPSGFAMHRLCSRNGRIVAIFISIIVVALLAATKLWLLYIPYRVNAVVGLAILGILIGFGNLLFYKVFKKLLTGFEAWVSGVTFGDE